MTTKKKVPLPPVPAPPPLGKELQVPVSIDRWMTATGQPRIISDGDTAVFYRGMVLWHKRMSGVKEIYTQVREARIAE